MNTCVFCFYTIVQDESGAWVVVGDPFQHFEDHEHAVTGSLDSIAQLAEYAGAV